MQELEKIIQEMQEVKEIMLSPKNIDCFGEPCKENDCLACVVNKCMEIVKSHMTDGWIPVDECLPEEKVNPISRDFYEYQVTANFGFGEDVRSYKFGNGHWWSGPGIVDQYAIAWRTLPEPYRPERSV